MKKTVVPIKMMLMIMMPMIMMTIIGRDAETRTGAIGKN